MALIGNQPHIQRFMPFSATMHLHTCIMASPDVMTVFKPRTPKLNIVHHRAIPHNCQEAAAFPEPAKRRATAA
ncbi:MAG: hypothetical protein MR295_03305 [Ruminococcus bromii]|nr:hypothetical protein [Ruminococcus bromii]